MAANIQFADYAVGQTLGALGPATTSIQLGAGQGALFPAAGAGPYFYVTLVDIATGGLTQHEVVKVTARAGDVLTVVRGGIIDGTPQSWPAGSGVELRDCAQALADIAALVGGGAPTTSQYVLMASDASLPNRRILTGSATINVADGGATNPVTLSVPANSVVNSILAQMPTNTLKGNNTGGLANALDLTVAQVVAMLGVPTTAGGVVSISAGTHAARPAFGTVGRVYIETDTLGIFYDTGAAWALIEPALTGDVTTAAGSLATTIANNAVTSAKIAAGAVGATQIAAGAVDNTKLAAMNAFTMKGNNTNAGASPSDLTVTQIQALTGMSIFNVKSPQYGAIGDGAADDTAAINAAYAAIPAGGGILYFPAGVYKVTAALTAWSKGIVAMGDSWTASTISTNSATLDVVTVTSTLRITNLRFWPSVARTAGREINITAGSQITIDNCLFNAYFTGVACASGGSALDINNCEFSNATPGTGIGIDISGGISATSITNTLIGATPGLNPAVGLRVTACGDLTLVNSSILAHVTGLSLSPGAGKTVGQVYCIGCFFDTCGNGVLIQPTGTGVVEHGSFSACWFGNNTAQGARIIGGGSTVVNGFDFVNCHVMINGGNGIQVDAGALNVRFIGGEVAQNTGDGLQFNATDFAVIGARIGTAGGLTGNTGYGVNVNQTTCDRFVVTANDLTGNSLGGLNNLSTQTNWITGQNIADLGKPIFQGNTLQADTSNATEALRFQIKNSIVNGNGGLGIIPNGTAQVSRVVVYGNSNLAAATSLGELRVDAAVGLISIRSNSINGGAVLPIVINIVGLGEAARWDALGNYIYKKSLADQGYSLQVPLTGFTITVPDNCSCLALNPAGVLATGTITMPVNPIDGQQVELTTTQTVTALTLNPNAGQTISGAIATITATAPAKYRYFLSITKWLKVSS